MVIYYDNDSVQHDGWVRKGRQDSTMRSFYRNGKVMEEGHYAQGGEGRGHGVVSTWTANPC